MFKTKLLAIKDHVEECSSVDIFNLVNHRLNKTFNLYVEELERSYQKILRKDELRVLRQLNKEGV